MKENKKRENNWKTYQQKKRMTQRKDQTNKLNKWEKEKRTEI